MSTVLRNIFYNLFLWLLFFHPHTAGARSISVKPLHFTKTLSLAIQQANPQDTIWVQQGTYKEGNILINKPLTIIGINYPVIDGDSKVENISVKSSYVSVSGLKIINSGYSNMEDYAGIRIYGNSFVRIQNNIFENNFFGIYLTNASYCFISNNTLTGPEREQNNVGNGIHLWKSTHNIIVGNVIRKHRDGIYFEFVKHGLIAHNLSEQNLRYGLHFMFSDSDTYYGNTFINNGAGVAVMYSRNVLMLKNYFIRNWGSSAYGLLLKDIRDSKVFGNTYEKNSIGIYMDGCSRTLFSKNNFTNNGYALKMQASCDENDFRFNNFKLNTFDYVTNGFTVLNRLQYNYWDRYNGFDLNKDGVGDQPFRPMNMLSGIIEKYPASVILIKSLMAELLDILEKIIPFLTPENLRDETPLIKPVA
ncbi:MAG: nitrous oxide reductase family maturation protein NosD [Bacteroidia bacterium]|nr:nitrous oxide reductase family maturation protein NosD [Bacteroidia bacterium]